MTTVSQPRRRPRTPRAPARPATTVSWPSSPPLERLLEDRPFAEISVDDLAKGAGISRPTFYFYFPSKDAVLLTLFERVIVEADATFEGRADDYADDPARVWRDGIYVFFETFARPPRGALAGVAATGNHRRDPRALVDVHAEVDRSHTRRSSTPNAHVAPRRTPCRL